MSTPEELSIFQISRDVNDLSVNLRTNKDDIAELKQDMARLVKQIEPLIEVYDGALFARKFVIGLSSIIVAIGLIGGGVIWLVTWIRHGG